MIKLTDTREQRDISGAPEDILNDAVNTLWNMGIIAEADMMQRGTYFDSDIAVPERFGAVCGGHRACAVGSLFLGARVPMEYHADRGSYQTISEKAAAQLVADGMHQRVWASLPNTDSSQRWKEFQKRPYLGVAYRALNNAAMKYLANHCPDVLLRFVGSAQAPFEGPTVGWAEYLFESSEVIPANELGGVFRDLTDQAIVLIDWSYVDDGPFHGLFKSIGEE